jgi:hypothetical protein
MEKYTGLAGFCQYPIGVKTRPKASLPHDPFLTEERRALLQSGFNATGKLVGQLQRLAENDGFDRFGDFLSIDGDAGLRDRFGELDDLGFATQSGDVDIGLSGGGVEVREQIALALSSPWRTFPVASVRSIRSGWL